MLKLGLFALGVILVDQGVKLWVLANFALGEARVFIPGVLQLRYIQNTGMAFSLFVGHPWIPMVLTPLILIVMGYLLFGKKLFPCQVQQFALAAVMAGGLSNWIDRIFHGFVIDMFEPAFMRFAVFNVADSFISVGGIVFVIAYILSETRKNRGEVAEKDVEADVISDVQEQGGE